MIMAAATDILLGLIKNSAFFKGELSKVYIEMESPVKPRSKVQRPRPNTIAILDAVGEGRQAFVGSTIGYNT